MEISKTAEENRCYALTVMDAAQMEVPSRVVLRTHCTTEYTSGADGEIGITVYVPRTRLNPARVRIVEL